MRTENGVKVGVLMEAEMQERKDTKEANQMQVNNSEATVPDPEVEPHVRVPMKLKSSRPFSILTVLDDKKDFISFMEWKYQPTGMEEQDVGKHPRYCGMEYYMYACECIAVSCIAALLEGEACVTADPNQHFPSGKYPLHYAAAGRSYAMVDLLLRHGARADVKTTRAYLYHKCCRDGLLPLNVALETLRTHKYLSGWNLKPYPPLLKMICIFCLPQMKAPLEICRLLAWNTPDADFDKVFNSYLMVEIGDPFEGLIEIAALLMVSREKIIDPNRGYMSTCESIERTIQELRYLGSSEVICLENKLILLEIFEKIGLTIDFYVKTIDSRTSKEKVVNDMKLLFALGGIPMEPEDTDLGDIDCENAKIKLATEILEKMLQSPNQSHPSVVIGSGSHERDLSQRFIIAQRWAMDGFFSLPNPVFEDGDHKFSRNTRKGDRPEHAEPEPTYERYRPKYHSPPTCSAPGHRMVPCHYSVRGYTSLARALKKLPRYI